MESRQIRVSGHEGVQQTLLLFYQLQRLWTQPCNRIFFFKNDHLLQSCCIVNRVTWSQRKVSYVYIVEIRLGRCRPKQNGRSFYATFQCYPYWWTISAASKPGIWHTRTRVPRYHRPLNLTLLELIWAGLDHRTGDQVAIKLEHHSIAPSLLNKEVDIYQSLGKKSGFPRVFWYGYQDDYKAMVFELLGPNLEDLFAYCGDRFSLKTTLLLMDQIFRRLKSFHMSDFYHRDIKPENLMLGTGTRGSLVYLTDLGLASDRPVHPIEFYKPKQNPKPSLVGTARYASINGHLDVCKFCPALTPCPTPIFSE